MLRGPFFPRRSGWDLTRHIYIEADLTMKEQALKRVEEPPNKYVRFRASDELITFLDGL